MKVVPGQGLVLINVHPADQASIYHRAPDCPFIHKRKHFLEGQTIQQTDRPTNPPTNHQTDMTAHREVILPLRQKKHSSHYNNETNMRDDQKQIQEKICFVYNAYLQ